MDSEVNIGNIGDILYSLGNITLLTMLTYWFERLMIFEMAEVETPSLLATSAKATPYVFTNLIEIRARTALTPLRRRPALNSSMETFPFLQILDINSSISRSCSLTGN